MIWKTNNNNQWHTNARNPQLSLLTGSDEASKSRLDLKRLGRKMKGPQRNPRRKLRSLKPLRVEELWGRYGFYPKWVFKNRYHLAVCRSVQLSFLTSVLLGTQSPLGSPWKKWCPRLRGKEHMNARSDRPMGLSTSSRHPGKGGPFKGGRKYFCSS